MCVRKRFSQSDCLAEQIFPPPPDAVRVLFRDHLAPRTKAAPMEVWVIWEQITLTLRHVICLWGGNRRSVHWGRNYEKIMFRAGAGERRITGNGTIIKLFEALGHSLHSCSNASLCLVSIFLFCFLDHSIDRSSQRQQKRGKFNLAETKTIALGVGRAEELFWWFKLVRIYLP